MDPSLLIAGYGAVLSSVLALPTLHRWRTDRPRLRVELSYEGTYEKLPGYEHVQEFPDDLQGVQLIANVKVDVWNDGRVDATVRDVALAFSVDHGEITALQPLYEPGEVVAIPAVNVRRFTIDHFDLQPPVPVDKPLRAYVVDGQGRIIWSRPVRLTGFSLPAVGALRTRFPPSNSTIKTYHRIFLNPCGSFGSHVIFDGATTSTPA